jgi:hypothetical protein
MGKFLHPASVRAHRGLDEQDAPTDAELAKIVWPPLPWKCPGRCKREYRTHTATVATLAPLADPSSATFLCIGCDFLDGVGAPADVIAIAPEDW